MEDGEAVLQEPVSGRHRGSSFSRQSVPPQAGVLLKTRFLSVDKTFPPFKKRFHCVVFFKSLEATTLMIRHLVDFLLIFTYSETPFFS